MVGTQFQDIYKSVWLAVVWCAVRLLPETQWHLVAQVFSAPYRWAMMRNSHPLAESIAKCLTRTNETPDLSKAKKAYSQLLIGLHERHMPVLREQSRTGWNPAIEISGLSHLHDCLQKGNGAILWVYPTLYYSLVTKKGLSEANLQALQFSHYAHGFSSSEFGVKYLNPTMMQAENKYLSNRLLFNKAISAGNFRDITAQLRGGGLVLITGGASGARIQNIPLFDRTFRLSSGPLSFAQAAHSPILPVFTFKIVSGQYRIYVDPALDLTGPNETNDLGVTSQYLSSMMKYVHEFPDQFPFWDRPENWSSSA